MTQNSTFKHSPEIQLMEDVTEVNIAQLRILRVELRRHPAQCILIDEMIELMRQHIILTKQVEILLHEAKTGKVSNFVAVIHLGGLAASVAEVRKQIVVNDTAFCAYSTTAMPIYA